MARKARALRACDYDQLSFQFPAPGIREIGLTQARLRDLLHYDQETGAFTWRVRRGGTANAGTEAGSTDTTGHLQVKVDRRLYLAHRLAWLYVHGYWPGMEIDHRDGDKQNNRLSNLRLATRQQNVQNRGIGRVNTSGIKGVSCRKNGKWTAQITVCGRNIYLGRFVDKEDAARAYASAARQYHGEFARAA